MFEDKNSAILIVFLKIQIKIIVSINKLIMISL